MHKITLKENGESFIKEAIAMYCREPSSVYRKAVSLVLLVQAVELLLKQKLANHSSLLLYESVDHPKKTVSMSSCLLRLAHLGQSPAQGKDGKSLERAIELRNKIVHHEYETNEMAIKVDFVRLCGLLHELRIDIYNEPLFELISRSEMEVFRREQSLLAEVQGRCKDELAKLKQNSNHGEPCWCGWCGNHSVKLSEDCIEDYEADGKCLICGASETYTKCARCEKWLPITELEEYGENNKMCLECLEYVTNDYWYESSIGK
jgi:hypothetical protein